MLILKLLWQNILYFFRCLLAKNPNNPHAPRLWDLKSGTILEVHVGNKIQSTYTIKRVVWQIGKHNGKLDPKAIVTDQIDQQREIYLSDAGVVPYSLKWHHNHVPFIRHN